MNAKYKLRLRMEVHNSPTNRWALKQDNISMPKFF